MNKPVKKIKPSFTIGIDEVGRGPIAGAVAVGAFVFLKPEAKKIVSRGQGIETINRIEKGRVVCDH